MLSLSPVSAENVLKLLNRVNVSKATGLDKLPARFIRSAASEIAAPDTHIINLTIYHGEIPTELKAARVVPLFKKQDKTEAGNYRPVSILSVFSKILERIVYDQLEVYLKNKSLLFELQSGFRPSYSTDTCLSYLADYVRKDIDKGNYTGMVMLDLQKAFHTVDHKILLTKLSALGVTNNCEMV